MPRTDSAWNTSTSQYDVAVDARATSRYPQVDPAGFERIEYGYRSVGVHFWTPQAYRAGQLAKKLRAPLMVALAVAFVALADKVLR